MILRKPCCGFLVYVPVAFIPLNIHYKFNMTKVEALPVIEAIMPGKQETSTERAFLPTENPIDDTKVDVVLPDMFRLFLSEPPRVNPHYYLVKSESEDWFSEFVFNSCSIQHPITLFLCRILSILNCFRLRTVSAQLGNVV